MTDRRDIADLDQRRHALDPERSFIVQAPAGSGKTELLIQRYLVLLSRVGQPEEIAAITFTKKAAAEMRKRVLESLVAARTGERPPEPHRALTWEHARAALAHDAQLGWRLEENAERLRIQTIDALCASLTRQMPVLASFGAQPRSVEDAGHLYREAARATLALLEGSGDGAQDIATLLAHLDNHVAVAEDLLAGMLAKRDHWLRNLAGRGRAADDRAALEAALGAVRREAMERALRLFPADCAGELLALATYAADNLAGTGVAADGRESPIRDAADLSSLPGTSESDIHAWLGLAELLLTQAGKWRAQVNVGQGFPAGTGKAGKAAAKEWKERHAALIARLADAGPPGEVLLAALVALRSLPPPRYTDLQWQALGAIARVLPLAVAELKLVFAARGEADFVEIAQGALAALGEPEAPTDLLLALDYRIHHILVDEFQDTSFTQFALLERLTAGWAVSGEEGEGRTLFLVGDPMQSIYRFREAEVGLFLKARREGIGQVALEPLTLSANFRSQAGIVDWVNRAFAQVMPHEENIAAGAVPYSPSEPVHPVRADAVRVHAFFNGDAIGEAQRVAALAAAARAEDPEGTVAVLVRNRSHLNQIVPSLKEHGLRYRAIEIEPLGNRQVVQDLLALTRALAHPADRVAWLAVLRAPWCGLTLADLHALCSPEPAPAGRGMARAPVADGGDPRRHQQQLFAELAVPLASPASAHIVTDDRTVWELLYDETRLGRLTPDARTRLLGRGEGGGAGCAGLRHMLAHAMDHRLRGSLRGRVESAWLALGGPACVENDTDLEDAEIFLDYLEETEEAGEIADFALLEEGIARLFALPDLQADPKTAVQIMTIHKAKGLEFDTVILPGLGSLTGRDDRELFVWMERVAPGNTDSARMDGPPYPGKTASSARMDASFARRREPGLLLAPINPTGTDLDPTYEYIRNFGKEKAGHESGRLLYVGATRAKKHLHLLGDTRLEAGGEAPGLKPPSAASLLAKLWPAVEDEFARSARSTPPAAASFPAGSGGGAGSEAIAAVDQRLRRLPLDWTLPSAPASVECNAPKTFAHAGEEIEFSWVGETARHVGSVVHRWLQRIADDAMQDWNRTRIEKMREAFREELAARGVEQQELAAAAERVARALVNSVEDPRGKWLLGPQTDAHSEYRIRGVVDGECRDLVIDRRFVDADGRRWIVDYKTSGHEGSDLEAFLERERIRYAAQLERYARTLSAGAGTSRLGLYFPLVSGWREWSDPG